MQPKNNPIPRRKGHGQCCARVQLPSASTNREELLDLASRIPTCWLGANLGRPPNSTPLADDLMHALQKLKVQEEEDERGSFAMLLHPDEAGVGVYVEDCDAGVSSDMHEDNWVYGETMPARTSGAQ
ncbi:hypothetical protein D9611_014971 [Ephemerocybe angulata]|uniref:Uncharacterized protein n=1 Tax=Ephemerocybe angulata TaxID=980116 RepID=A0A8H5B6U5_9AGAR|nr:hypothetical protein D9611_014971 [Tulosesus angulatus]